MICFMRWELIVRAWLASIGSCMLCLLSPILLSIAAALPLSLGRGWCGRRLVLCCCRPTIEASFENATEFLAFSTKG